MESLVRRGGGRGWIGEGGGARGGRRRVYGLRQRGCKLETIADKVHFAFNLDTSKWDLN